LTNQQLYLTIGIPSILVILAWLSNNSKLDKLSDKVDRHYENFNNQITTLLTTIHGVDTRVARLEEHK
jgi:hypothetical protein